MLTPCVFPLIPITVSIFGARHAKRKTVAALLSGSYVLGIALMYTALGMAAAATGTVFVRVMGNPWVITAIAALFIVFALSMKSRCPPNDYNGHHTWEAPVSAEHSAWGS